MTLGMFFVGFWILLKGSMSMRTEILQLERQPLGVIMCKQLCQRVYGCHVVTYNTVDLSCHLGNLQYYPQKSGRWKYVFNLTKAAAIGNDANKRCPLGSIMLKDKTKHVNCIEYERPESENLINKTSTNLASEYFNMSETTLSLCQKTFQLCDSGKLKAAQSAFFRLCKIIIETSFELGVINAIENYVSNRCSVAGRHPSRDTLLHTVIVSGYINMVRCILYKQRINVDVRGRHRLTPIMLAVQNDQKDIVSLLLNAGCDLSMADASGNNVLHIACMEGSLSIVKDIVSKGVLSIDTKGKNGMTPILSAIKLRRKDIFYYLVETSNLMLANDDGINILHFASEKGLANIVEYIIRNRKVDIECKDNIGRTSVMIAASRGHKNVFDLLVQNHCNLSVVDTWGRSILEIASKGGNNEIVRALSKLKGNSGSAIRN